MTRQRRTRQPVEPTLPTEQPETLRVKVSEGWAVYYDGRHCTDEVLEVPTDLAAEWLHAGLIDRQVP